MRGYGIQLEMKKKKKKETKDLLAALEVAEGREVAGIAQLPGRRAARRVQADAENLHRVEENERLEKRMER